MDSRLWIAATGAAALALAWSPARGQSTFEPRTQAASDEAEVDPAFAALHKEFLSALRSHQAELKKARDAKVPRAEWPSSPIRDFWPRFEALAKADDANALQWCLGQIDDLELPDAERNAQRLGFYRKLIEKFPDHKATRDALRLLVSDAAPERLGLETASGLCAEAAKRATKDEVRAYALYMQAQVHASVKDDEAQRTRAGELYGEVATRFPALELGARAKGKQFALEHLRIGKVPPDFTATDVDGVSFKLSDYRGKVVVLDFWGFW